MVILQTRSRSPIDVVLSPTALASRYTPSEAPILHTLCTYLPVNSPLPGGSEKTPPPSTQNQKLGYVPASGTTHTCILNLRHLDPDPVSVCRGSWISASVVDLFFLFNRQSTTSGQPLPHLLFTITFVFGGAFVQSMDLGPFSS